MLYIRTKNIKQQSFFDTYSIHFVGKKMFSALFVMLICVLSANANAKEVKVIDGDSFFLNGKEIRLEGIDAPEYQQTCFDKNDKIYDCGVLASEALKKMIKGKIKCKYLKFDRYKRRVAVCYADNVCLNEEMVKNGWAVAYTNYSDDYVEVEQMAKMNKKGIWQGRFMRPDLFRALNREK